MSISKQFIAVCTFGLLYNIVLAHDHDSYCNYGYLEEFWPGLFIENECNSYKVDSIGSGSFEFVCSSGNGIFNWYSNMDCSGSPYYQQSPKYGYYKCCDELVQDCESNCDIYSLEGAFHEQSIDCSTDKSQYANFKLYSTGINGKCINGTQLMVHN